MELDLITKDDLASLKTEIIDEISKILSADQKPKKWLKTREVCDLLKCSPGTLQNLRINRVIEYTKIGGTLYYSTESINNILEANKKNAT